MRALSQDLRYALRTLRRSPGFAATVIISTALGIGANTAIFSLVHTLVLRPLPVDAPGELVEPLSWLPNSDAPRANAFAWKHYRHFRDHAHAFSGLIASSPVRLRSGGSGDTASIEAEYVDGNFFSMLGVRPALGRLLEPTDDRADAPSTVVISWTYWQRQYHGDPSAVGQSLVLNGESATIVGVTPRPFFGLQVGLSPDAWIPMAVEPRTQQPSRLADGSLMVRIMGRLRSDRSRAQAEAEMRVLDQQRIADLVTIAPFWQKVQLLIVPASTGISGVRDLFAGPLMMLMGVALVLLLIACANVAALLLARGLARQREISVRIAIGAGRGRLVRQLITESLLLAAIGGALGMVIAVTGGNLLVRMLLSGRMPPGFPAAFDIQVQADGMALIFTAGTVLITGVLFGLAPATHAWSTAPGIALRESAMGGDTPRRRFLSHSLVVAQIALSIALLTGTGLLLTHVTRLKNVDTGLQRERVLLVRLNPAASGYEPHQLFAPYRTVLERLETSPAIASATVSAVTPIQGPGAARMVEVPGFTEAPETRKFIPINIVGPRYFETFGTPLIAGRDFSDDDIGHARVAIVNQSMARYYFGADDPVGKRFAFAGRPETYEIVGLVADVKYQQLTDVAPRTIYVHAFQEPRMLANALSVRTRVPETAIVADVRQVVESVLKPGSVERVTTLDQQMDASITIERTIATLSAFFGALGALLVAVGLYGLLAYTVTRRTREIGVRMALGARRGDVLALVIRNAAALVLAGIVIGLPIVFWEQRIAVATLSNFTVDLPVTALVAVAEMVGVALLAAYLPARRAVSVNPTAALRQE